MEDTQENRVKALLEEHEAPALRGKMKEVVKEGLRKCFSHIQTELGVQSGDQACYFIGHDDEEAVENWLTDYAMSEIALCTPDDHPKQEEVFRAYSSKGLKVAGYTAYQLNRAKRNGCEIGSYAQ